MHLTNPLSPTSLSFSKETGTIAHLSTFLLSILLFILLKLLASFSNVSISKLSISDIKIAKSAFLANFDLPTPVTFFKSGFAA